MMADDTLAAIKDRYPEKYQSLLADDVWEYIAEIESWYPPEAKTWSIAKQRDVFDQLCRAFFFGYPPSISVVDEHVERSDHSVLGLRVYTLKGQELADRTGAPPAVVLYFHGGGFVLGGLDSHDDVCSELCDRTGFGVVSVDYRLCPEHRFPSDFLDAIAGFEWAAQFGIPLILMGDSAGANLAAALASEMSGASDVEVLGQVLVYPTLSGAMDLASYEEHASAPLLRVKDMAFFQMARTGGDVSLALDACCAPLSADDFSGLPTTRMFTAECDPLCSDGEAYCAAVRLAGGDAVCVEERGLVHGYMRARTKVGIAREAFGRIVEAVSSLSV